MATVSRKAYRPRMIHVRLDEETHRQLKVHIARQGITIQQLVEGLIHRKVVTPESKSVRK